MAMTTPARVNQLELASRPGLPFRPELDDQARTHCLLSHRLAYLATGETQDQAPQSRHLTNLLPPIRCGAIVAATGERSNDAPHLLHWYLYRLVTTR